jgi:FtsP/CotA-like multicopper oxidase with cupredoxin domain
LLALCFLTLAALSSRAADEPEHIRANDNRSPAGALSRQQLQIELEAREGLWFPESHDGPGVPVQAFAERGKPLLIPGPMIRVPEGTRIRATVRNTLSMTLTLHGLHTHPVDSPAPIRIAPGETRDLDFDAGEPGTYFYWGSTMQGGPVTKLPTYRDGPLSGAFIVDSRAEPADPTERVFVISQWRENPALDPPNVLASHPAQRRTFAINGYAWPYTERLTYDLNRPIRWRWINATFEWHPLHLHGFYYEILSLGDAKRDVPYPPAQRPRVVTNRFDPGATMSMRWTPERVGNWLFHCHILDHIDPTVRLRPSSAHASHADNHANEAMSGLVMGITIREPAGYAHVPPSPARRQMKLLVQEQPRHFGEKAALGYVLAKEDAATAENSVDIPGPLLVLTRNEPTSIEVVNRTREETSVHWHGMELESFYDGVPGWGGDSRRTTPPIRPSESFVAHMTPPRAGTFIYHTHWHDVHQLTSGMYGPLIVLEPGEKYDPQTERMILLSAGPSERRFAEPLLINGSEKPIPMQMSVGVTYRLRLINITADNANFNVTLSKDGDLVRWRAIAKDGADLPEAQRIEANAEQILTVGETRDYEVHPIAPGDLKFEVRNIAGAVRGVLNVEVR